MSERGLAGRTAWVTGGATGMGHAIALQLAEAGCNVALGSLPQDRKLPPAAYAAQPVAAAIEEAAKAVRRRGVKCFAKSFDVREDASLDDFLDAARTALGAIDVLVNAAGVSAQEPIAGHDDETWEAVLDINLNGPYRTIKRCLPAMIEQGWGRIVNIASTAAEVGFPGHSAYCASKSALLGLTRCVALEGAGHGVTCNAINPGSVGTEMMRLGSLRRIAQGGQGTTVEENWARIAEAMPQRRLVPASEVATLAVYLCSDDALGITGEALTVSGGALW